MGTGASPPRESVRKPAREYEPQLAPRKAAFDQLERVDPHLGAALRMAGVELLSSDGAFRRKARFDRVRFVKEVMG
jgi:hypothetical protein